ncbi:hypothetical protein [Paenarthrobacter ilicis]|uniref:hypothetical protein n=1 Tax=Paenarthrobacter ilicis TaxID=43665 RepID=UPI0028D6FA42|nr:hypothetical protein [Paenarthrobacter ilicis]
MSTTSRGHFNALLSRAGFLAVALAIIAGIFGMHLMTGTYHSSAAHPAPAATSGSSADLTHMQTNHPRTTEPSRTGTPIMAAGSGSPSSCSAGSCPEVSSGHNACVLATGNTILSAPLPGTAPYALPDFGVSAVAGVSYTYSPASPSPGELCISRT